MPPDLRGAQRAVEDLMIDAVQIVRNVGGAGDDVLNETTGVLEPPSGGIVPVYGASSTGLDGRPLGHRSALGGIGKVQSIDNGRPITSGYTTIESTYYLGIPLDAPDVLIGDWAKITFAARDQRLLNRTFSVEFVRASTFAVSRRLTVKVNDRVAW